MNIKKIAWVLVLYMLVLGVSANVHAQSYDGVYKFDLEAFKAELIKQDPNVAQVQGLLDQMADGFKDMSIEIKGKEAIVSMQEMVVKGALTEVSKNATEATYKMVPFDEDKKNDPLMLTIKGNALIATPEGKAATDAMYFKK